MIIAFDIGGTSIKYGVIDESKENLEFILKSEVDTDAKKIKGPGILNKIKSLIETVMYEFELKGIAISTAGMVDAQKGSIIYANENIPEYTGMKLKDSLENQFHIPCWVENDVNSAALGETVFGAAKGSISALVLTIGTGVGGAIVLNGEVYHGYSGGAGEIGYMWIDGSQYEKIASTTSLVRNVEKRTAQKDLNGKIVFDLAKQDDEIAKDEICKLCQNIVLGISNCVCVLNPQTVVLGGGIMTQKEYLEPIMNEYFRSFLNEEMVKNTTLKFAELKNDAGMAGAYAYWKKQEVKRAN